ncbi:hypothetical protein TNCV_255441 [Trichonephila clavipes]|nr:hypothetical protein TNCV_255441 [Trichonephila clavipes]
MLIQSASSQPELVRGTVDLLENSINMRIKEQHKRMEEITQQIYVPNSTAGSCDEAHFWLNGYVNKQNCRIWSEANPQVFVETPLHPEKLTVWCVLFMGWWNHWSVLLQKRRRPQRYSQ